MSNIKLWFTNLWNSIKSVLSVVSANLAVVMTAVIALLLFVLKLKNKQLADLQSQMDLVKTKDESEALEVKINAQLASANQSQQDINNLQNMLNTLQQQRAKLPPADPTKIFEDK